MIDERALRRMQILYDKDKILIELKGISNNTLLLAKNWCDEYIDEYDWDCIIHNPVINPHTFDAMIRRTGGDVSFFFTHDSHATLFTLKFS